jgi:kynurenine formamidase
MPVSLRVVDLTRTLAEDSVLWPGTPPLEVVAGESIEQDGSFTRRVTLDEHSGTHFDAPSHFAPGAWHVADVPASRLVCPLHVIDISSRARGDASAVLTVADVVGHESEHGPVTEGSAVFLRTDWVTPPGGAVLDFPGFGVAAARLLVEERGVVGLGIDTLGIDPGSASDFPVHRDVSLQKGVWHVENLTGLSGVPAVGAWAVVGVPRVSGASGFPARVLALVPSAR